MFRFLLRFRFQRFRSRTLFVEDQQPGKDIVPDLLRPTITILLATRPPIFVVVLFFLELGDECVAHAEGPRDLTPGHEITVLGEIVDATRPSQTGPSPPAAPSP